MSDSDDTDVLLLIPPDFFSPSNHHSADELSHHHHHHSPSTCTCTTTENTVVMKEENLQQQLYDHYLNRNEPMMNRSNRSPNSSAKLYHSTPYVKGLSSSNNGFGAGHHPHHHDATESNGLINEIDHYLDGGGGGGAASTATTTMTPPIEKMSTTASEATTRVRRGATDYRSLANEAIQRHQSLSATNAIGTSSSMYRPASERTADEEPLISLSELWGTDVADQHADCLLSQQHEERIRRQHCEKTIQILQSRLLEYQQKISVAIKVDRQKDEALNRFHTTNANLVSKVNQLEAKLAAANESQHNENQMLRRENAEILKQNSALQIDLNKSIDLMKTLQERNTLLEGKSESLSRTTTEIRDIHRKQLTDLEVRVSNGRQTEQLLHAEIVKLKTELNLRVQENETLTKEKAEFDRSLEDARNEAVKVKQQKIAESEKLRDERNRADNLDKQKKSLAIKMDQLAEKEKNLHKELEAQRVSLKAYYQTQLEQVVAKKLHEFQIQLDTAESRLRSDAKDREMLIAQRAIQQMDLINQKNEQEFDLIAEKHREEIELYRIQLSNASKAIDHLNGQLAAYQRKRSDIAEKLHDVMEAQWMRTLAIITNPNDSAATTGEAAAAAPSPVTMKNVKSPVNNRLPAACLDRMDGVAKLYHNRPENEGFETRTEKNINDGSSDKLQQYIELLLKRSPRDLDSLEGILSIPNRSSSAIKLDQQQQQHKSEKKPWK